MKQEAEEKHYGDDGEVVIGPSKTSCNSEPRVPALHQVGDLESMIQRPLKVCGRTCIIARAYRLYAKRAYN